MNDKGRETAFGNTYNINHYQGSLHNNNAL